MTVMNGREKWHECTNINNKQLELWYGSCTSRRFWSSTYEILGYLIFVGSLLTYNQII